MNSSAHAVVFRRRLRRWISRLDIDLVTLLISDHIFNETRALVDQNRKVWTPHDFHVWLTYDHFSSACVSIRRLMDHRKDVVSVRRMIEEIAVHSSLVTRHSLARMLPSPSYGFATTYFDSLAGNGVRSLPSRIPKTDLARLVRGEDQFRRLVNKRLAHLDVRNLRRRNPGIPQITAYVADLHKTYLKYRFLLTGRFLGSLLPAFSHDWKAVFDHPWRPASQAMEPTGASGAREEADLRGLRPRGKTLR